MIKPSQSNEMHEGVNVSDVVGEATAKTKEAILESAENARDQVKDVLDRQITHGVELAGHFAKSVRVGAEELGKQSPMLADLVEIFADKIEDYVDEFQDTTVDHLTRTVSDFTRRRPALVFGLGALAGFLVSRAFKGAMNTDVHSIKPSGELGEKNTHHAT